MFTLPFINPNQSSEGGEIRWLQSEDNEPLRLRYLLLLPSLSKDANKRINEQTMPNGLLAIIFVAQFVLHSKSHQTRSACGSMTCCILNGISVWDKEQDDGLYE